MKTNKLYSYAYFAFQLCLKKHSTYIYFTYPFDVVAQGVALNYLFSFVSVNNGVKTIKGSSSHNVSNSFFLNAESLDLVIYVEK